MTKPMTCDELALMLADYLEDDLDDATRERVEMHALACAGCGSLLDDVQHLVLLVNMRPGPCARAEGDVQEVRFVIFLRHSRVALSFSRKQSMAG